MFCDKCGREIRHDSTYCSYCGTPVEPSEEQTSDSESSGSLTGENHSAPCVTPRAPKKHCQDCQKELPASSISDICALCSIRRRNRELEQNRVDSDAAYAKLDRYDISDEFDQSVFQGNKYYKSNPDSEPLYRQRNEKPHVSPFKKYEEEVERKSARTQRTMQWLVVIIVITLLGIFGNLADFGKSDTYSSVSAVESETSAAPDQPSGWEELPVASLAPDGSMLQTTDEGFVPQSYDDIPLRVSEVTMYELNKLLTANGAIPSNTSIGNGKFSYEGAYLNAKGTAFYNDGNGYETTSDVFEITLMMTRTQYIVIAASLGGVEQYDLRPAIAPDGTLTEHGAIAVSDETGEVYAGEPFFDEPVIFPDDYRQ